MHDYATAGSRLFQDNNAWTVLSEKLILFLKDPLLHNQILVVDALDECITELGLLLNLIASSVQETSVRWLLSSRNVHEVEMGLRCCQVKIKLSLVSRRCSHHYSKLVY